MRFPDQNFSVILLGNLSSHNSIAMSRKVADIYLNDLMESKQEATNNTSNSQAADVAPYKANNLNQYTGTFYSDELDVDYKIFLEKGELLCQVKYNSPFQMTATSKDNFTFQGVQVQFTKSNDKINGFNLNAGRVKNLEFVKQ